jgi:hypothetical protein
MIADYAIIESFTRALREVAIECLLNDDDACRVCSPTNKPLFTDDIKTDLRNPDPCTQVKEEKVKAKSITVGDTEYFYQEDAGSIYDYKVFKFDSLINVYRAIRENTSEFASVISAING